MTTTMNIISGRLDVNIMSCIGRSVIITVWPSAMQNISQSVSQTLAAL